MGYVGHSFMPGPTTVSMQAGGVSPALRAQAVTEGPLVGMEESCYWWRDGEGILGNTASLLLGG